MRAAMGLLVMMVAALSAPGGAAKLAAGPQTCGGQRSVWHAAYLPAQPPARCAHVIGTVALPHGGSAFHT